VRLWIRAWQKVLNWASASLAATSSQKINLPRQSGGAQTTKRHLYAGVAQFRNVAGTAWTKRRGRTRRRRRRRRRRRKRRRRRRWWRMSH
jgi:hypothetical protein